MAYVKDKINGVNVLDRSMVDKIINKWDMRICDKTETNSKATAQRVRSGSRIFRKNEGLVR
jgi:hypothetical protein